MFFNREFADEFYEKEVESGMEQIYSDFVKVKDTIVKALSDKNTDMDAIMNKLREGTGGNVYFTQSLRSKNCGKADRKYHFDPSHEEVNDTDEAYTDEARSWMDFVSDVTCVGFPSSDAGRSFILFRIGISRGKTWHKFFSECREEERKPAPNEYANTYPITLMFVDIAIVDVGHCRQGIYSLTKLPPLAAKRVFEYANQNEEY